MKWIFKFLEEHKKLVGLSDYKILIGVESLTDGDKANVDIDIYEKTMRISLFPEFNKEKLEIKENILLHELIHGRYAIYQETIEKMIAFEEENLMNDITRGMMYLKNKK